MTEYDCFNRPDPECLIALSHQAEQEIDQPATRVIILTRIAVAEALAGYSERAEQSFARATEIFFTPGLFDGLDLAAHGIPTKPCAIIYLAPPRGRRTLSDPLLFQSEELTRSTFREFLVTAQVEAGYSAENVARYIQRLGATEHGTTLNLAATRVCVAMGKKDAARLFLQAASDNPGKLAPGNTLTRMLTDIFPLWIRIGDWEKAIAMTTDLDNPLPNSTVVGAMISVADQLEIDGYRKTALKTLTLAGQHIANIEDDEERESMRGMYEMSVAHITGKAEDVNDNKATVDVERSRDVSPNRMAVAEAERGEFKNAVTKVLEFDDATDRDNALASIARKQARNGDTGGACKTASLITHAFFRSAIHFSIAEVDAKEGNVDAFKAAVREIADEGLQNICLTDGVRLLAEAGNAVGAASIARDLPLPAQRATAYVTIAIAMVENGAAEKPLPD